MIDAARLLRVPGCGQGEPPRVLRALPGGRGRNAIHYLETSAGRFVLRERLPPRERPGADPLQELRCHRAAAARGLAPGIVDAAPDGAWILMEWMPGRPWTAADLLQPPAVASLGRRLALLHSVPLPAEVLPLDVLGLARAQRSLIETRHRAALVEADALLRSLQALLDDAGSHSGAAALCHGDLQMANCLGDPPCFVDWEYAQHADPTYDIACLLTYYPRLESQLGTLLDAAGLAGAGARARLARQQRVFSILDRLWALAQSGETG